MEKILLLIFCHLFGDLVLQSTYLAQQKVTSMFYLICHCFVYIFPFYVAFGYDALKLTLLFVAHVIVDYLKTRKNAFSSAVDQTIHAVTMVIIYCIL